MALWTLAHLWAYKSAQGLSAQQEEPEVSKRRGLSSCQREAKQLPKPRECFQLNKAEHPRKSFQSPGVIVKQQKKKQCEELCMNNGGKENSCRSPSRFSVFVLSEVSFARPKLSATDTSNIPAMDMPQMSAERGRKTPHKLSFLPRGRSIPRFFAPKSLTFGSSSIT